MNQQFSPPPESSESDDFSRFAPQVAQLMQEKADLDRKVEELSILLQDAYRVLDETRNLFKREQRAHSTTRGELAAYRENYYEARLALANANALLRDKLIATPLGGIE